MTTPLLGRPHTPPSHSRPRSGNEIKSVVNAVERFGRWPMGKIDQTHMWQVGPLGTGQAGTGQAGTEQGYGGTVPASGVEVDQSWAGRAWPACSPWRHSSCVPRQPKWPSARPLFHPHPHPPSHTHTHTPPCCSWRKVGWIFAQSTKERDFIMSSEEICQMAAVQVGDPARWRQSGTSSQARAAWQERA